MNDRPFLHMIGISKRFGSIQALKEVEFEVRAGEVMALVGENGAGKSTLVKTLVGLHRPDSGRILIRGEPVDLSTTEKAQEARIAVVQQELALVPTLSVAENLFLGNARSTPWQTPRRLAHEARPFLDLVGLAELDPLQPVARLSAAERQLIETARLLSRDARVLIFDEPTAALSDREIERVMQVVRSLREEGRSVIYVTHRLGEVFELADRVTVFRDGRSQEPVPVNQLSLDDLVERMIGTVLGHLYPPRSSGVGETALRARDVTTEGLSMPVSLEVRRGEILGLAGQLGAGPTALLRALAGTRPRGGVLEVAGEMLPPHLVSRAVDRGLVYCSADRKADGLFLIRPVGENLTAPALDRVTRAGWLSRRRERRLAKEVAGVFTVDLSRLRSVTGQLSGGNQQKVALGKWLSPRPTVLMVDEPTRGVDIGARAEIYSHLRHLAEGGLSVVFASSDIQEVLGLADAVATFYRGRMVSLAPVDEMDQARVLREVTHPDGDREGAA